MTDDIENATELTTLRNELTKAWHNPYIQPWDPPPKTEKKAYA